VRRLLCALLACVLLSACAAQPAAPSAPAQSPPAVSAAAPQAQPIPEPEPEPEPEPLPPTPEEQAQAILDGMTREERLGQLFFVRYPGEDALAQKWAQEYHLGGYILFGREFKESNPDGVREKIAACQQESAVPMLIAVDEEGGSVVRASCYPAFRAERFPSPQKLFSKGGLEAVREDALEKSTFLKELGINVNLAPVADVSTDPGDFIYSRAFGQDAQATAEYVEIVVSAMEEMGMGSVLKHFPGYGNNLDTHTGIAMDKRPLDQFLKEDLLPFSAGAQAGAGGVLVSHNIVSCLDDTLPASLSPAAYTLLRQEVGFDGVAMTDDMDMKAVAQYAKDGSAAVLALAAGADMVLTSDPVGQLAQVRSALEEGSLTWDRVEQAALRVLTWKIKLGLL